MPSLAALRPREASLGPSVTSTVLARMGMADGAVKVGSALVSVVNAVWRPSAASSLVAPTAGAVATRPAVGIRSLAARAVAVPPAARVVGPVGSTGPSIVVVTPSEPPERK